MRCRHARSSGVGRRLAGKIVQFARVAREIEQLLAGIERVEDVLVAPVGERVPVILRAVADAVFEIQNTAPRCVLAGDQGQQAAPIQRARGGAPAASRKVGSTSRNSTSCVQ